MGWRDWASEDRVGRKVVCGFWIESCIVYAREHCCWVGLGKREKGRKELGRREREREITISYICISTFV
jgi:hypothetical protein